MNTYPTRIHPPIPITIATISGDNNIINNQKRKLAALFILRIIIFKILAFKAAISKIP